MKRVTHVIGGLVAVAAIWTGGWFAGKSFLVEPEADRIVEELRAGDFFFSYESREVGGFPIAYDVAYRGVKVSTAAGGWEWTTPAMSVASGVADGGAVIVTPADEARLVVDAPVFGGAAEDPPAVFDISSRGLAVTLAGPGERVAIAAETVSAMRAAGGGALKDATVAFTGLDATGVVAPDGGEADVELTATEAQFAYVVSPDGVAESRSDTLMRGLKASFRGTRLAYVGFADFVAAGGEAKVVMEMDGFTGDGGAEGGPNAAPISFTMSGGRSTADIEFAGGRARYAATLQEAEYTLELEQPSPFPGGAFGVGAGDFLIEVPIVKTEGDVAPYSVRFGLTNLTLGDEIWGALDPGAKIERTPLTLKADLAGDARVIHALGAESFGESPIAVDTVDIRDLSLEGLGASVTAAGALSVAGNVGAPEGAVTVEARGVFALLDRVGAAGLMPGPQVELFKALALGYARQGDGPDHLIAEIESSSGGVSINGKPLR